VTSSRTPVRAGATIASDDSERRLQLPLPMSLEELHV
jgi:hypothetical protein